MGSESIANVCIECCLFSTAAKIKVVAIQIIFLGKLHVSFLR